MEDCGINNAEYLVHLVCTYRLCACREFCGVHIVGNLNGTRCRDGCKCCGVIPISLVGF